MAVTMAPAASVAVVAVPPPEAEEEEEEEGRGLEGMRVCWTRLKRAVEVRGCAVVWACYPQNPHPNLSHPPHRR